MSGNVTRDDGFEAVKARLEEIADAVGNEEVPLDEALDLFEEAVSLGMQVSDLLEEGVLAPLEADADDAASHSIPDQPASQGVQSASMAE